MPSFWNFVTVVFCNQKKTGIKDNIIGRAWQIIQGKQDYPPQAGMRRGEGVADRGGQGWESATSPGGSGECEKSQQ